MMYRNSEQQASEKGQPLLGDNEKYVVRAESDLEDPGGHCCFVRPVPKETRYCGGRLSCNQGLTVCAVSTAVVTTIVLCVGILVGGKSMAEGAIDASAIEVVSMDITAYDADARWFTADISASLQNTYPLGTYVKSTKVDMRFEGQTFAKFDFPAMKVRASALKEFTIEQSRVEVTNLEIFNQFNSQLLQEEEAVVNFYTESLSARALGITFTDMTMDKDISLQGINNFETFPLEVSDIDAVGNTADEIYLTMDAALFNPSPVSFVDLGRMKLDIEYNGTVIGYGESALFQNGNSTPLVRGDNSYPFLARIVRTAQNSDVISEVMSNFVAGLDTDIVLVGTEDSTDILLLKGAFATLRTSGTMPGIAKEDLLVRYGSAAMPMDIQWNNQGDYEYPQCSDTTENIGIQASIVMRNPFSIPVHVQSGRLTASLQDAPTVNATAVPITFSAPFDKELYLGYVDIEEWITLDANIEDPATGAYLDGITVVNQVMCLDDIMDCGCKSPPELELIPGYNPGSFVAFCPAVSLANYIEVQLGARGVVTHPVDPNNLSRYSEYGSPGNAVSKIGGDVVASLGNCVRDPVTGEPQDEDAQNGLRCFKSLSLSLIQERIPLAISLAPPQVSKTGYYCRSCLNEEVPGVIPPLDPSCLLKNESSLPRS